MKAKLKYSGQVSEFPLESSHQTGVLNMLRLLAGERINARVRGIKHSKMERRLRALAIKIVIQELQKLIDKLDEDAVQEDSGTDGLAQFRAAKHLMLMKKQP